MLVIQIVVGHYSSMNKDFTANTGVLPSVAEAIERMHILQLHHTIPTKFLGSKVWPVCGADIYEPIV
jgi:hypothetical protein